VSERAVEALAAAGIVVTPAESESIELADFGLGGSRRSGSRCSST
jgi:hypothetical protein